MKSQQQPDHKECYKQQNNTLHLIKWKKCIEEQREGLNEQTIPNNDQIKSMLFPTQKFFECFLFHMKDLKMSQT